MDNPFPGTTSPQDKAARKTTKARADAAGNLDDLLALADISWQDTSELAKAEAWAPRPLTAAEIKHDQFDPHALPAEDTPEIAPRA